MGTDWTAVAAGFAAAPLVYFASKAVLAYRRVNVDNAIHSEPLKVVVTGSSKGLGNALAHAFLQAGDSVVVNSRDAARCEAAAARLAQKFPSSTVRCFTADVGVAEQADRLADFAVAELGRVDIWVNNAGASQSIKGNLINTDAAVIQQVVTTNLLGAIFGSRAAMRVMEQQPSPGGKIFLMDGQGATGWATPNNAAYGATKAAVVQLKASLAAQVRGSPVAVHIASPGMVATDLLGAAVSGADNPQRAARFLNVFAEDPDTVARWMVPRMRGITGNGLYFRYLTPFGAAWKLATRWRSSRNRFFPENIKAS